MLFERQNLHFQFNDYAIYIHKPLLDLGMPFAIIKVFFKTLVLLFVLFIFYLEGELNKLLKFTTGKENVSVKLTHVPYEVRNIVDSLNNSFTLCKSFVNVILYKLDRSFAFAYYEMMDEYYLYIKYNFFYSYAFNLNTLYSYLDRYFLISFYIELDPTACFSRNLLCPKSRKIKETKLSSYIRQVRILLHS